MSYLVTRDSFLKQSVLWAYRMRLLAVHSLTHGDSPYGYIVGEVRKRQ